MNLFDIYSDLEWRGLIHQSTDPALPHVLQERPMTLYCGFDPTADSLHIGSLLPLMTLRRFQQAGHRIIAVVGGATGMIGDPSFKAQERSLLTPAALEKNLAGISEVIAKFLNVHGANAASIKNNADWFGPLTALEFLRDVGKHFTVNLMMGKESVRARLEDRDHGISYTEFSYMLLQAYDFYVLHEREGCRLQIGGSDQWGNITAGTELIRRMRSHLDQSPVETFGLTQPLVVKADGTKFGKSERGNIWLSADKTSPYQFYQFFIQSSDLDVIRYLKYFTFLSREEIEALEECVKTSPEKREAQIRLAREMTLLVHGSSELDRVEKTTQALFQGRITDLDARSLEEAFSEAPVGQISMADIQQGHPLIDLLAESGACASKGAARKDLQGGGIYLNGERMTDVNFKIQESHLLHGRYLVIRKGKKNYTLVRAS